MKWFICYLVVVTLTILIPQISGHTCNGVIINDTNMTFDLFTSSIVNGKLITAPEVRLLPYTQTTFTLESNFGVNDRIEYDWGYLPEDVWCTNNTAPITGSYKYEYGSNSCDSDSITCYDTAETLSSSYQNCDGVWNYSYPTFNIYLTN